MTKPLTIIKPGLLICNPNNSSDGYHRRIFSWLTRIGAAPKFGTYSFAHYQECQCKALRYLEESKGAGFPLRCKRGMVQYKPTIGKWQDIITVSTLLQVANLR